MSIGIGIGIPFYRASGGSAPSNTPRTQAFLTATGITDATIISALNTMDNSLISAGLLPSGTGAGKIKALYPFVGATAGTHKFNFVNPLDTNAAFRLAFAGGWTHSINGALGNGTNSNANTFIQMQSAFRDNISFYWYLRNASGNSNPIMAASPNNGSINFYPSFGGDIYARINGGGGPHGSTPAPTKGFFASRSNSSQILVGRNGSYTTYSQSSDPPSNQEILLGGNSSIAYTDNQIAMFTVASGLTNGEGISLDSIVVAFQTTLGRNV